jgi:glutamyl-tRNA reductase
VLGAGVAGTLVARRARFLGFERIVVASRRPPDHPADFGADSWLPLGEIAGAGPFDVAVSCLGPSAPELTRDDLPGARGYIDLGSPPNLAPGVQPVVRLADIVGAQVSDPVEAGRREGLHSRLREILENRLAMAWERSDTPVGRIRREVEAVRRREVARIGRLHPELSPQAIEDLTRGLVNQIFHTPSERLRAIDDAELGERLADLFSTEGTSR